MSTGLDFLLGSQSSDGGWGYRAGAMSFVEATAAVMLALAQQPVSTALDAARLRARDWLFSVQHADGGWGIAAIDVESGWMTAWAVLALANVTGAEAAVAHGVDWLTATVGLSTSSSTERDQIYAINRMDASLRGWPWQSGDWSFVQPTAFAIQALAAVDRQGHTRVKQGVAFLLNRALPSGGWNFGNPEMFGNVIPATIQDTAITLSALRSAGRDRGDKQVDQAIEWVSRAVQEARTASELAWGARVLRDWNMEAGSVLEHLNALEEANGSWQANPYTTAIALLASRA